MTEGVAPLGGGKRGSVAGQVRPDTSVWSTARTDGSPDQLHLLRIVLPAILASELLGGEGGRQGRSSTRSIAPSRRAGPRDSGTRRGPATQVRLRALRAARSAFTLRAS